MPSGSSARSTRARSATCSRTPSPRRCCAASAPSPAASRRSTRKAASELLGARRTTAAADLTPRESEVLALVRQGLANKQIARRLGISRAHGQGPPHLGVPADRRRRPHPGRAVGRAERPRADQRRARRRRAVELAGVAGAVRQRRRSAAELGAQRLEGAPVAQPGLVGPPVARLLGVHGSLARSPPPCARWRAGRPRRGRSAASRRCRDRPAGAWPGRRRGCAR